MMRTRTRDAFDRHAANYDERFSASAPAQAVRERVWQIADPLFAPGSRILDLGCGTGDDSIHFAGRGLRVHAIDISPRMIGQLAVKAAAAGMADRIEVEAADLESVHADRRGYDGLFSNFGALNCVPRLEAVRELASIALKPGSPVVLVLMGRFYPLETLLFLLKGDVRRAFRRLRRSTVALVEGVDVPVWYHSPRNLQRDLGPDFSLQAVYGLRAADRLLARFPSLGAFSDHYVSVWRFR